MPEEPKNPDLVELEKRLIDAVGRRDLDAITSLYAPDGVWDMAGTGFGTFEGRAAIRGFYEDWLASYEEYRIEAEEILDLGHGVGFRVLVQKGRPVGSTSEVQLRYANVSEWEDGKIKRITNYPEIDEARAAAERLAQERNDG